MDLIMLKQHNMINIYKEIIKGNNTISSIAKELNISNLSVSNLTSEMAKMEILKIISPKRDRVGRRSYVFSPTNRYYSVFIDKQAAFFRIIGIATSGRVTERFDIALNHNNNSVQEVFDNYVIKRLKTSPTYKFCMSIYLSGIDIDEIIVDDTVRKATREELIAESFIDNNKIMLFNFNTKYILSIYSHIYTPTVDIDTLSQSIPIHDYLSFQGDLYNETFDALQRLTSNNIEKIIKTAFAE